MPHFLKRRRRVEAAALLCVPSLVFFLAYSASDALLGWLGAGAGAAAEERDIYVYFAHNFTEMVQDNFQRMERDVASAGAVAYLMFDDTHLPPPAPGARRLVGTVAVPGQRLLLVSEDDCRQANSLHDSIYWTLYTVWGLLYLHLRYESFRFVWFLEYDVYCHGSYAACLNITSDAEFVGGHVRSFADEPAWSWWNSTQGALGAVPLARRVKTFCPLARLSKRLLGDIYYEFGISGGHTELYVPTLASERGYALDSFPESRAGYIGLQQHVNISELPTAPNDKIYHPVKHG